MTLERPKRGTKLPLQNCGTNDRKKCEKASQKIKILQKGWFQRQRNKWKPPLILGWTNFFLDSLADKIFNGLQDCEYQCTTTNDRRYLTL